ncbi:MAG TPA: PIG-L family deacetylase [Sphingomicrobium sp.]
MKHVYVSPHSDDVALSCGGQILANARQAEVLVLNMFTSESDSAGSRLFDSVNAQRTQEDEAAWEGVGVPTAYANLPEALLRKKFPFELKGPQDDPVVADVSDVLADCAKSNPDATFHVPAGFGSHVDHLACKRAAFRLLDQGRLGRIVLYEDVPYSWLRFVRSQYYRTLLRDVDITSESRKTAFRAEGESFLTYLRRKQVPFPRGKKLFPAVYLALVAGNFGIRRSAAKYQGKLSVITLDAGQMAKKKKLIDHYRSQIPMLFGDDPEKLLGRLHDSFSKEVSIEVTRKGSH